MTTVIGLDRDDDVVRELLAPFARVQPVALQRHRTRQRLRRFRPVLAVAVAVAALAGAGAAAATGVLPWWHTHQAVEELPFFTSTDPAALPGSTVSLSVPGPESLTLEVITNNSETVGAVHEHCSALVAKDAQGHTIRGLTGCGAASAAVAKAGSFDWQAPSGATYTVITGPSPISSAVKVALLDSDGDTVATEPVEDGQYLVYAPAAVSTASLVFYNEHGQVVGELDSPHS